MQRAFVKLSLALVLPLFLMAPALRAAEAAKDAAPAKEDKASDQADAQAKAGDSTKAEDKAAGKAGDAAEEQQAPGHRSPGLAGTLAFFPGMAVHGAGHMYAGSWMKGLGLLAIEGVAVGVGINTFNSGYDNIQKVSDSISKGGNLSGAGDSIRDVGVVLVCSMAFLWTWWDDMAGAPIAAGEYNKLLDERASQARLQVSPRADGATVAWVRHF